MLQMHSVPNRNTKIRGSLSRWKKTWKLARFHVDDLLRTVKKCTKNYIARVVLLIKRFVWWRSRCRCRRVLRKVPNFIAHQIKSSSLMSVCFETFISYPYLLRKSKQIRKVTTGNTFILFVRNTSLMYTVIRVLRRRVYCIELNSTARLASLWRKTVLLKKCFHNISH